MESIVTSAATSIPNSERSILVSGDLAVGSSNKVSDLEIKLHYRIQHYKLSSNEKSFTLLSLFSQIGGFVGIFLGYSLLQLPELLGCASTETQKFADNFKRLSQSIQSQPLECIPFETTECTRSQLTEVIQSLPTDCKHSEATDDKIIIDMFLKNGSKCHTAYKPFKSLRRLTIDTQQQKDHKKYALNVGLN